MKNRIIAANWKSNKTKNEAKNWLEEVSKTEVPADTEVIIFAPFTLLDFLSSFVLEKGLNINVGAQDVSQFEEGAYTGAINAGQIREFCEYALIGHSERRNYFQDDPSIIKKKIENSVSAGITPVICISNFDEARDYESTKEAIFAFEPPSAIGSGNPEEISVVSEFSQKFNSTFTKKLIYGGSVSSENSKDYLNIPGIAGLLVGSESLSPGSFLQIVNNA
jgi:triosephosphate isomerase